MLLKKTALATFIALSLTACGSSGGGSNNNATEQRITQLTNTLNITQSQLTAEEQKATQLKTQIDVAQQKIMQIQNELTTAKTDSAQKIEQLTAKLNQAQITLETTQKNLSTASEKITEITGERNTLQIQKEDATKQIEAAQQKIMQIQNELATEKAASAQKTEQLTAELNQATEKLAAFEQKERAELEKEQQKQAEKEAHIAENKQENAQYDQEFMQELGDNERYGVQEIGFVDQQYEEKNATNTRIGTNRLYNQAYSIVFGRTENIRYHNGESYSQRFNVRGVHGNLTDTATIPTEGRATYQGIAFGAFDKGDFSYTIDFANRTGKGIIRNLADVANRADVILEEGKINGNTIQSTLKAHIEPLPTSENAYGTYDLKGRYILGIYGPNAEEVAGKAILDDIERNQMLRASYRSNNDGYTSEIGFGGTRGEIQK